MGQSEIIAYFYDGIQSKIGFKLHAFNPKTVAESIKRAWYIEREEMEKRAHLDGSQRTRNDLEAIENSYEDRDQFRRIQKYGLS